MIDKVRKAMEALEARNIKPSVRKVREELGNKGGFTEIGEAIREIKAEREALNAVRNDLPRALQDKAGILAIDLWRACQEISNREIEDIRKGCELRVAAAENQAEEALRDIDDAEARIRDLEQKHAELEKVERIATERAEVAQTRVGSLEAEIRAMQEHAKQRERELEHAYEGVNRIVEALGAKHKAKPAKSSGNAKQPEVTG